MACTEIVGGGRTLTTAAFMIIAAGVVLYGILAGMDAGIGLWFLATARSPRRAELRGALLAQFSPVWEANGLFLIFALTGLFAAFPAALGRLGTAFIPLYLPAVLLIPVRGASYTLLHHRSARVRELAVLLFGTSSVGIGLLFGYTTLGLPAGILRGTELDAGYFTTLASFSSVAFIVLGMAYAGATSMSGELFGRLAARVGCAWFISVPVYGYAVARANPFFRQHLAGPLAIPIGLGLAAAAAGLALRRRRPAVRLLAAAGWVTAGLGTAAASLPYIAYPAVRVSSAAGPSLKAYVVASAAGGPLLLLALAILYAIVVPGPEVGARY